MKRQGKHFKEKLGSWVAKCFSLTVYESRALLCVSFVLLSLLLFHSFLADQSASVANRFISRDSGSVAGATLLFLSSKLNSKSPDTHFALGKLLRLTHEYGSALEEFEKTLALMPNYPRANLEIGRLHFISSSLVSIERAIDSFSREVEVTSHPYAYHERGILYGTIGRFDEAEKDFRTEMSLWDSWGAPLNLAWALFAQGRLDEAEAMMHVVDERNPDSVFAHNGLGVIYLNQGKHKEAIHVLEKAFQLAAIMTEEEYRYAFPGNDPNEAADGIINIRAGIAINLGVVHEKMGDTGTAAGWYKQAKMLMTDASRVFVAQGVSAAFLDERIQMLESR